MKKMHFVLMVAILWTGIVQSQPNNPGLDITRTQFQAKQVIPPSPEAAELGKYGNVPVSLFTGTPSISIPLVELKGNFLSLPVSLSYNHTGLKPEEIAPWTGLGWALKAGGVITRSVLGEPDLTDNYYKSPSPLSAVPSDEFQKQNYYQSIRMKETETQPDIFYYNFMGHTGKFMLRPDGSVVNKEKSYLKIVPFSTSESDFTITDEQGIRYEFEAFEHTLVTPRDDREEAPPMLVRNYISSWYLSKVIAPNGAEELEFEYYSPQYAQSTINLSPVNKSITYTRALVAHYLGDESMEEQVRSSEYTNIPPGIGIYKKFIKKVTLRKNNIMIGYIDFESDENARVDLGDADFNGERMLKKLKLYNTSNSVSTLIKEFSLTYNYFGISQPEFPGYYRRLMLKTVQEISPNPTATPSPPAYTFHYNGEAAEMPGRYTTGLDHWGYYNGTTNEYGGHPTLIPTVYVPGDWVSGERGFNANREPDNSFSLLTVLQRINYPTGGYTTFDYEGNNASRSPSNITPIGGVRIREMIDHSFPDKPAIVKRYEYKYDDGSLSGEVINYPVYYTTFSWEDMTGCRPNQLNQASVVVRTWNATIMASSAFGLGTIQGSHIGYRRVTEYQTDLATNKPLGKTVYTYNILGGNEIDEHIGNGELVKQQTYDNGDKLLEEVTNTYIYEDLENEKLISRNLYSSLAQSNATKLHNKIVGSTIYYRYFAPIPCVPKEPGFVPLSDVPTQSYFLENGFLPQRKKLDQQVRKIYDNISNTYLTYSKKFTYDNANHAYPTLIEEVDSKGDKVFTSVKYVADYTIGCPSTAQTGSMAAALTGMQQKNMMGLPVEKLQYRINPGGGNRRYINGLFTQYKSGLPEKLYFLETNPVPTSIMPSQASCIANAQSIDNNYRQVATLTYDALMNLQEERKTNDFVTTYFWGYDNRYPVAKVVGKTHNESLTSGINQSVLNNPASESTLRTELNKLRSLSGPLVSTHTYLPMVGMTSATEPDGQLLTYEYDVLNRLVHIKDNNEIIKNFRYNYGLGTAPVTSPQTLFYNATAQGTYTKQGCPNGSVGEQMTYVVPFGKYARLNQTEANNLAAADLAANGQNYANSAGRCIWYNETQYSELLYKECSPTQGPAIPWRQTVYAGKYRSFISQEDANNQAKAEFAVINQSWINAHGQCSCEGTGRRFINGVCESPPPTVIGGSFENGQYKCYFQYIFSDGSTDYSIDYFFYQSEPCPVAP